MAPLPGFCCRLIALEMAKIHTIHANGSLPKPTLWHKMHKYFTLVKEEIGPRYSRPGLACSHPGPSTVVSRQGLGLADEQVLWWDQCCPFTPTTLHILT